MFAKIGAAIKGVLARMGLLATINNVTQFAAVIESQWMYDRILDWRSLYRGYLGKYDGIPYHETSYIDAVGKRHHRKRASLKMPKKSAERMASLVFNEKCQINIGSINGQPDENGDIHATPEIKQFSANVMDVLDDNHFHKLFQRYLEYMFAMGGMVAKPYVDNGKIKISWVTAQNFLPVGSNNDDITAGVFMDMTRKGDKYYTHLEWHTWDGDTYHIRNELYQSMSPDDLGVKVPLSLLYENMEDDIPIQGLTRPLFVYFKPNIANNFETSSPLGISIFGNALDTLKTLDIAFDSYQREFSLGKRRIIVPASAIRAIYDPKTGEVHRYFDTDDEVYQAVATGDMEADQIKDMAVALRVDDHVKAINSLLDLLSMQQGFSPGTFTFDGQQVKTATEVVSENSETFRTKNSHETLIEQGIKDLIDCIAQLADLYDIFTNPGDDNYEVTVDFDDSIAEDRTQNANFYITLVAAELMPKVEAIQRIFDITEDQANEWMSKIKAESAQQQPPIMSAIMGKAEYGIENADAQSR
ncbi:phage portal protein [Sporolactobacillus laevolacticus]|uniref:Portal protein n=1 Tax=Sporolactobacillus laevolacticus DSM 442 TaxID=1395513 RepID=V6IVF6_9BACL|nr:phage portal protein [Sporolactobacillus laevolacticus]EST11105.1 portal protein [Sporolactobacillus laevolacticus DSM 442]